MKVCEFIFAFNLYILIFVGINLKYLINSYNEFILYYIKFIHNLFHWGLGIGDWGVGNWGLGQNPKPHPHSPNPKHHNPIKYT